MTEKPLKELVGLSEFLQQAPQESINKLEKIGENLAREGVSFQGEVKGSTPKPPARGMSASKQKNTPRGM